MKIDNFRKSAVYRLVYPILFAIAISFIAYFFIDSASYKILWLILGLCAVLVYVYFLLKKPHYLGIEIKSRIIIVRYYNPHPFFERRKAFEVPIQNFEKYKIKEEMMGKRRMLTFFVRKGNKIGSYPPVSATLMTKTQLDSLEKELNTLLKIKKL